MELTRLFTEKPDWATAWLVQVFGIVFLTLGLYFILRRFLQPLAAQSPGLTGLLGRCVRQGPAKTAGFLVLFIGLSLVLDIVRHHFELALFTALGPFRMLGVVLLFAWFLMRLIREGEEAIIAKYEDKGEAYDRATMDAITKLLQMFVIITATLVVLQTLG